MTKVDKRTVFRVLDALGPARVYNGLTAFDHEPEGDFCNCFATDCFKEELVWPKTQEGRRTWMRNSSLLPQFENGEHLDSHNISMRINVAHNDAFMVFCTAYEERPEDLIMMIMDWFEKRGL